MPDTPYSVLTAAYKAPSQSKHFEQTLPALSSAHTTDDKTVYLGQLKAAVGQLQGEVNRYLTSRMEQDVRTASDSTAQTKLEHSEEENYGEEVVE